MKKYPTEWKDVTIGMYQEMCLIDNELDDMDKRIQQLSILDDMDSYQIRELPLIQLYKRLEETKFIFKPIDADLNHTFVFKDVEYGFYPNLHELKSSEMLDNHNWSKDSNTNLHRITALIYRPITKKNADGSYEIEKYGNVEHRAALFKDLPITTIQGGYVFFSLLSMEYTQIILSSSMVEAKTKEKKRKKTTRGQTKEKTKQTR